MTGGDLVFFIDGVKKAIREIKELAGEAHGDGGTEKVGGVAA